MYLEVATGYVGIGKTGLGIHDESGISLFHSSNPCGALLQTGQSLASQTHSSKTRLPVKIFVTII